MAASAGKRKRPVSVREIPDETPKHTIRTVYSNSSLDGRWSLLLSLPGDLIRLIVNHHCNEYDRVVLRHVCYTHLFTPLPNAHHWHFWSGKGKLWLKYAIKTCSSYSLTTWILQRGMFDLDSEQCTGWAASASNWAIIDRMTSYLTKDFSDQASRDEYVLEHIVLERVKTLEMAKQTVVHPLMVADPNQFGKCWEPALLYQNLELLNWLHERKVLYKADYAQDALRRGRSTSVEWLLQRGYMLPYECEIVPSSLAPQLHQRGMSGLNFFAIISRDNDIDLLKWAVSNGQLDKRENQLYVIYHALCDNRIDHLDYMLLEQHIQFPSSNESAIRPSNFIKFTTAKWLDDHGFLSNLSDDLQYHLTMSAAQQLDIPFLIFLSNRHFSIDCVACTQSILESNDQEPILLDQTYQTLDWLWTRFPPRENLPAMTELCGCLCDMLDLTTVRYALGWFAEHTFYALAFRAAWNGMSGPDKIGIMVSIHADLIDGAAKLTSLLALDLWFKGEYTSKAFYGAARNGNLAVMQILVDNFGFRYKLDKLTHACNGPASIRNLVLNWTNKNPVGAPSKKPRQLISLPPVSI